MASRILSINVTKDNLREVLEKIEREYKDARWCNSRKKPTEFFPYDAGCIYLYDDYDITYGSEIELAILDNVISAECFLKEEQRSVNHAEWYESKLIELGGVDDGK